MIEAAVFIGAVIAGITEIFRHLSPQVNGAVTVGVAVLVGIVIALLDTEIGVADVTVAQGVLLGLATAGVVGTAKKIG